MRLTPASAGRPEFTWPPPLSLRRGSTTNSAGPTASAPADRSSTGFSTDRPDSARGLHGGDTRVGGEGFFERGRGADVAGGGAGGEEEDALLGHALTNAERLAKDDGQMARQNEFITYLLEQLAPLGEVRARGMFGGFGIYLGERMFALVSGDTFFIKADEVNRVEFESRGLQPFQPEMRGKKSVLPYWQPPAEAMDDGEMLCEWARKGVEAAERAASGKKRRR